MPVVLCALLGQQGRIQLLGINHLEVKMVCGLGGGSMLVPIRVFISNPTGYAVRIEKYYEVCSVGRQDTACGARVASTIDFPFGNRCHITAA